MQANRRQNRLPHQHRAGEHPRVICHLSRRGEPSGSAQDVFRLGRRVFAPAPQAVFSPSIPQRRGVARGFSLPFFETFCIFLFRYYEMFCPIPWKGGSQAWQPGGDAPFWLPPGGSCLPVTGSPPKPSASGFGGERRCDGVSETCPASQGRGSQRAAGLQVCTAQRPPPDFPATPVHAAPCVRALWPLPQAPSDPACAGPPPSQREAFGPAPQKLRRQAGSAGLPPCATKDLPFPRFGGTMCGSLWRTQTSTKKGVTT